MSNFKYDFFISRRGSDAEEAKLVYETLRSHGYSVCEQSQSFSTGDELADTLTARTAESRHFLILLGEDYRHSPWTRLELAEFLEDREPGSDRRLIVLRVDDCDPAGLLKLVTYQDLVGVEDLDERRRLILEAAQGKSGPKPFRTVSTRLVDGLTSLGELSDAWQRFLQPVAFVGREEELHTLLEFADGVTDERPVQWQVLFGNHATGKSRLATEWLRKLAARETPWHVGFAPNRPEELLELANLRPSRPTAIVIDDAASYGDAVWEFVDKAAAWRDPRHPVRLLLVAHTDLDGPSTSSFKLAQQVKALRQTKDADLGTKDAGPRKPVTVAKAGCELNPVASDRNLRRLFDAARQAAGWTTEDTVDAKKLIAEAEGRPAFVLLAGYYGENWHDKLFEYAEALSRHARELFQGTRDGLRVLLASVLVGPITDAELAPLAPAARSPEALKKLFPDAGAELADGVPRFQPDVLGHMVVFTCLRDFSLSDREAVARQLAGLNRDRFAAQLSGMTDLSLVREAYRSRLSTHPPEQVAEVINILDMLVSVAAESERHQINTPSADMAYKHRDLVLSVLADPEAEHPDFASLVKSALRYSPRNSLAQFILEGIDAFGMDRSYLHRWLGLIDVMTQSIDRTIVREVEMVSPMARNPAETDGGAALMEAIKGKEGVERYFAAFEIAQWAQKWSKKEDAPAWRADFTPVLINMLEKSEAAEKIAAAWALKNLLAGSEAGRNDWFVMSASARKRLCKAARRWLKAPDFGDDIFQIVQSIGMVGQVPWAQWRPLDWLETVYHVKRPGRPNPSFGEKAVLRRLAAGDYDATRVDAENNRDIQEHASRSIIALGEFDMSLAPCLRNWFERSRWGAGREHFLVSLAQLKNRKARRFLNQLLEASDHLEKDLTALAAFSFIDDNRGLLNDLLVHAAGAELSFDLAQLYAQFKKTQRTDAWSESPFKELKQALRKIRLASSPHLVHKLKAKDSTGRWAYYFVHVLPRNESSFIEAIGGRGMISLEDYGTVVASCYGEAPNEDVKRFLRDEYEYNI